MRRAVFLAVVLSVLLEGTSAATGSSIGQQPRTAGSSLSATNGLARRGKASTAADQGAKRRKARSGGSVADAGKRKRNRPVRKQGEEDGERADPDENTAAASSRRRQNANRKCSSQSIQTRGKISSASATDLKGKVAHALDGTDTDRDGGEKSEESEGELKLGSDVDGDEDEDGEQADEEEGDGSYYNDGGYGEKRKIHRQSNHREYGTRSSRESSRRPASRSSRPVTKKSGGIVKGMSKLASKSANAMVRTLQPKSVGIGEILDTWKLEQVVGKAPGRVTKCAATIQFRRDGTVATSYNGRESVSDFTFRAHSWPRACTIEFEARAFQGPWDEEPVWKVYKGTFSRKLLDPKIITLEGKIYDVMGKMMWKRRVKSGTFTARRRPTRSTRGSRSGARTYRGGAITASRIATEITKRGTKSKSRATEETMAKARIWRTAEGKDEAEHRDRAKGQRSGDGKTKGNRRSRTWIDGGDRERSAQVGRKCRIVEDVNEEC